MKRSFLPLHFTNFFGVINDNFLKTLAGFAVIGWLADDRMQSVFMGLTAGALVLPYILFTPLADRLTILFPKRKILLFAKWAELPIIAIGICGFIAESPALVLGSILLMGLQSSLYSPAKYALVRDIGGQERLSSGMGGMEGITFLGVLAGTIAASFAADSAPAWVQYCALGFFALAGLIGSFTVRADEELSRQIHSVNPVRYLKRAWRIAKGYHGINSVIFTLSIFWWGAAMLQMGLLVYGKQVMKLDDTHTGAMLCAAAVGIAAGQVVAGFVNKKHFLLGASAVTGGIASLLLFTLFFVPMNATAFATVLALLAFDFGFFKLPFDVEIQRVVKGAKVNTMLAYFNQVSFIFMLMASGCYALISWLFGPRAFLLLLAVVFLIAPVLFTISYRGTLISAAHWILRRRYDVISDGLEKLHPEKTYLVLPNHPAMVDPMLVTTEFRNIPLRPLSDELFFRTGIIAPLALRAVGAVEVPDLRKHRSSAGATMARGLTDVVKKALSEGNSIIFYPSGHIQTEGDVESIGNRQLAYNICRDLPEGVEVVGVRTRGLWGSIWGRKGRKESPNFGVTLLKSIFLWIFVAPFTAKRKVTMHIENITDATREWAKLTRLEFNRNLESWYNS